MWVRWWFSAGKRESGLLCESGYQRTQMNSKKKPARESGQKAKVAFPIAGTGLLEINLAQCVHICNQYLQIHNLSYNIILVTRFNNQ